MVYDTNNMKAQLLIHDKQTDDLSNTVEIKVWRVPVSKHTPHGYKYSLVYIVKGTRVIGYDNERGKGDHRHFEGGEEAYPLLAVRQLIADFLKDIEEYKERNHAG